MIQGERYTPDLVIFDCDGVLIDSEALSLPVEAAILAEHGFSITVDEIRERYVGHSLASMFADLEKRFDRSLPDGFETMLRQRIEALFEAELAAMDGVAALVDALDCGKCVASSSLPARLRHTLSLVGLYEKFAPHIFSASQVERGKPAPDLFLFAAERMGAAPSRCLVIEDSVAGVHAARAAGMTVLGFCGGGHCGNGHGERLRREGAAASFDGMAALAAVLPCRK
jgi:HAD superfamily hydrolase (TIGR01509 family)